MLECVVNISDSRNRPEISAIAATAAPLVLDIHSDDDHNRSVLTLAGPAGPLVRALQELARAVVDRLDITGHHGVHPRIGTLDVVPFVDLGGADAMAARHRFASWAGAELALPCFLYGPERSLPEVRRRAWTDLAPDYGPDRPHPRAGAAAVGARPVLVAYNLWLAGGDLDTARRIAAAVRRPGLRTLGLAVGHRFQVSCNLIDPFRLGPGAAYDLVAARHPVEGAELVGLVPAAVLESEPAARWPELDIDRSKTIEARLEQAGLDGGSFRVPAS
ncbi:MAG TPA: hypothetical protein VG435_11130 [Acidimicrobiales bacterium]|jgi:glutamate formiminotransferase|nr:hypothetical protein [Acidimicrobiales bacterium]